MNERDKLIKKLREEKGGSHEDYLNLLNAISYHESAHTNDPTIKQMGGGPGRGKFQFEEGKNAGGITAARRTKKYYEKNKIPVPKWLIEANKGDSLDATKLTAEQQDVLFLGNMREHPKANFKNVWEGKESVSDFWANYHWAGADKDRSTRLKSFDKSLDSLKKNPNFKYTDQPSNTSLAKNVSEISVPEINTPKPSLANDVAINGIFDNNYSTPKRPIRERVTENTAVDTVKYKAPELNPLMDNVSKDGNIANLMSYINNNNVLALGGKLPTSGTTEGLNSFNTGGTHDQNPYGGIAQGTGTNGQPNTVEQGETSFNLTGIGKFVFSDRIKTNGSGVTPSNKNTFENGGVIDPPKVQPVNNVETGKSFVQNWFNNDITRDKMSGNLKNYNKANGLINRGLINSNKTEATVYPKQGKSDGMYANNKVDFFGEPTAETSAHEYTHSMGNIDKVMSNHIKDTYGGLYQNIRDNSGLDTDQAFAKQFKQNADSFVGKQSIEALKENASYMNNDGELYPRFMEMRQFLNVKPGDVITDDQINKLQKNKNTSVLFKYYSPEKIKEILNTVASNNSSNQYKNIV